MMKIGEVAQQAGVSVDTVRFYERRGLLPTPRRRPSGYRVYDATTIPRIRFTKALQALGFNLDEVLTVLTLVDEDASNCQQTLPQFEGVLKRIDEQLATLTALRQDLLAVMDGCQAGACVLQASFLKPMS